jgi:hypothetical protein
MPVSVAIEIANAREVGEQVTRRVLTAGTETIAEATRGLEQGLETLTREAVGGRLWRAWKSRIYPDRGGPARNPAGEVFVNGGERSRGAMVFFSRAGRIQPRGGRLLWFPLPAAGPRGRDRLLTPEEWEAKHGVKLRPVFRPGHAPLLVLDRGVLSGRKQVGVPNTPGRRGRGRGDVTIPMFVGMPNVAFANRFAVEPEVERWGGRIPGIFARRVRG